MIWLTSILWDFGAKRCHQLLVSPGFDWRRVSLMPLKGQRSWSTAGKKTRGGGGGKIPGGWVRGKNSFSNFPPPGKFYSPEKTRAATWKIHTLFKSFATPRAGVLSVE